MKKFDYKKKPSIIRTLKEPPKKKKKINWDRVLFLAAIFIGLFFLLRHTYKSVALVEADGQVMLESIKVNFINDIRLRNLKVTEGDTVQALDTLFSYWNELHDDDGSKSVQINNTNEWVRKEKLNLLRKISQKNVELREATRLLEEYGAQKEKLVQFVMLDAAENSSLQAVTNQLLSLESRQEILRNEVFYLRRHYNQLRSEEATLVDLTSGGYSSALTSNLYISPFRGIIGEIQIQPNEVCYEGEYVFTIHSPEKIAIHAYFSQKNIDRIFLNEIVKVSFPDGSEGRGYIKKYHISTKELPPEFQKKYEPTERTILTEIFPIDEETATLWKKFYKMDVRVSLPRFRSEIYMPDRESDEQISNSNNPIKSSIQPNKKVN